MVRARVLLSGDMLNAFLVPGAFFRLNLFRLCSEGWKEQMRNSPTRSKTIGPRIAGW